MLSIPSQDSSRHQIGVVGYGDFSQVLIKYLSPYADIVVSSRSKNKGDAGYGARFSGVEEVLARDIIIPSIPAQFFPEFLTKNADSINPDSLFIDVCSVKVRPLQAMERLLPASCEILGTHPLFGPSSISQNGGVAGLKCVVSPVRISQTGLSMVKKLLVDELRLQLIEKTAVQHDKEMAYVQGLSHYIGRVMQHMDIPMSELSTLAYDDLLAMKNTQGGDSWELFQSIMEQNPYADAVNKLFKKACVELDAKIADAD